jgi:signal transduction histidine kinase
MDAGRFESSPRPFALHRAIQSIMGPVGVATAAKQLPLVVELDPAIDALADGEQSEGLWVIGDEIRLRQVLTNLTSNAVKFSPEGGGPIRVVTKLLVPAREGGGANGMPKGTPSAVEKGQLRSPLAGGNDRRLVIRMEVHDSGPGSAYAFSSPLIITDRLFFG